MMRTVFKSVRKDDSGFKNYDFNTCNKIDTRYDDHNSRSYISNSLIKRPI